jgi:hypothetical protein
MEEKRNALGLSDDDLENVKMIMDDLLDVVAKFNSLDEITEEDYANVKMVLDFANFVVSGVIYSNGIDLCAGHGHGSEDDDE